MNNKKRTKSIIAASWWSQTLLQKLSEKVNTAKFNSGKKLYNYDHIYNFTLDETGNIKCTVQSLKKQFFDIEIRIKKFSADQRKNLINLFSENIDFLADFFNDELSQDNYEFLKKDTEIDLFFNWDEVEYSCSCNHKNLCEHTTASIIKLINEIRYTPLLLLHLRGIKIKDLITTIFDYEKSEEITLEFKDFLDKSNYDINNKREEIIPAQIDIKNYFGSSDFNYEEEPLKPSKLFLQTINQGKFNKNFSEGIKIIQEFCRQRVAKT